MAQCHGLYETILAVIFVGKPNKFVIHLLYTMVADSDFVRVTPQIFYHRLGRTKWSLGINHPVLLKKCFSRRFFYFQSFA